MLFAKMDFKVAARNAAAAAAAAAAAELHGEGDISWKIFANREQFRLI